jgi:hypothetical protein
MTTNNQLNSAATNMALTTPHITTGLYDSNGNPMLDFTATASAVNYFTFTNQATTQAPYAQVSGPDTNISFLVSSKGTGQFGIYGESFGVQIAQFIPVASAVNFVSLQNNTTGNSPNIAAVGSDTNVTLTLTGQGTSGVAIKGVSTNSSAAAGYVGELLSSGYTSGVSISSGSGTAIQSLVLTAGDWDVWGTLTTAPAGGTTQTLVNYCLSTSSGSLPGCSSAATMAQHNVIGIAALGTAFNGQTGVLPISVSGSTTIYLNAYIAYSGSTLTAGGIIVARRVR